MMISIRSRQALALLGAVALVGAAGCSVEQTEQARTPDVDVQVEPGRWPQYKVNWADVDVGTTTREITVPVVRVVEERRQVSVPYIDIQPPGDAEREERTVSMEVDVPHAGYRLEIAEVRAAEDDLWVIARLIESDRPGAQVVTRASDQVVVNAPADLDVRKVIVGARPSGTFNQQYRFATSMEALERHIPDGARVIYQREGGAASPSDGA